MTLPNKIGYDVHSIAEKKKLVAEQHKAALLAQQVSSMIDNHWLPFSINMSLTWGKDRLKWDLHQLLLKQSLKNVDVHSRRKLNVLLGKFYTSAVTLTIIDAT